MHDSIYGFGDQAMGEDFSPCALAIEIPPRPVQEPEPEPIPYTEPGPSMRSIVNAIRNTREWLEGMSRLDSRYLYPPDGA